MKKLTIGLQALLFACIATAGTPATVTLPNGEVATVLQVNGTNTGYLKAVNTKDGKQELEPGSVFNGVKIVKLANGSCAKVESFLESMESVNTAAGTIQRPKITTAVTSVGCPG